MRTLFASLRCFVLLRTHLSANKVHLPQRPSRSLHQSPLSNNRRMILMPKMSHGGIQTCTPVVEHAAMVKGVTANALSHPNVVLSMVIVARPLTIALLFQSPLLPQPLLTAITTEGSPVPVEEDERAMAYVPTRLNVAPSTGTAARLLTIALLFQSPLSPQLLLPAMEGSSALAVEDLLATVYVPTLPNAVQNTDSAARQPCIAATIMPAGMLGRAYPTFNPAQTVDSSNKRRHNSTKTAYLCRVWRRSNSSRCKVRRFLAAAAAAK